MIRAPGKIMQPPCLGLPPNEAVANRRKRLVSCPDCEWCLDSPCFQAEVAAHVNQELYRTACRCLTITL